MKTMILAASLALAATTSGGTTAVSARAATADPAAAPAVTALLDYLHNQNSTGIVVERDGKVLIDRSWPAPTGEPAFAAFVYGRTADGALLEDVASQQKSFVAILLAVAIDKGLLDIDKPVSAYLGAGWSKALPEKEARIRVLDVMRMSSGLDERFGYVAPAGSVFFYNTPVYAITKRIVAAAAGQPLETITRDWLTGPAGMKDTGWRKRPAMLASVGNDTGLVTTPHDVARFGEMVLHRGVAAGGRRVVSKAQLAALFARSPTNPAYGRLWWLNGGAYSYRALVAQRREGPLVPAAPADMVGAFGAFDRRLYVVPSLKLVVVRTGATPGDKDFDQQLWLRLNKVLG